jgi:hypothetical protein
MPRLNYRTDPDGWDQTLASNRSLCGLCGRNPRHYDIKHGSFALCIRCLESNRGAKYGIAIPTAEIAYGLWQGAGYPRYIKWADWDKLVPGPEFKHPREVRA